MSVDIRLPIVLRQLRLPTVVTNYRKFAQEAAQSRQPYEDSNSKYDRPVGCMPWSQVPWQASVPILAQFSKASRRLGLLTMPY